MYREIRNSDGRLICRIKESDAGTEIEIIVKKILTQIRWTAEGKICITHTRSKQIAT